MYPTRAGVDLAKSVLQMHGVDRHEKVAARKKFNRAQMHAYFKALPPCLIGMEACATSHYWARVLMSYGHTVKLIAAQFVKPYVKGGKNDANDAEAICEAVGRPTMRFVAVKTVEQQVMQAEHRIRSRLVRSRTALCNEIRGLLGEFGIVVPVGAQQLRKALPVIEADESSGLTPRFLTLLRELAEELRQVDDRVKLHDKRIQAAAHEDHRIRRLLEIEGIGPVSASALVAAVGDAKQFASGRDMAAWLGLVPSQHSSGGKERLGGISKRGDTYLRTLLIHGARAALNVCANKDDARSRWAQSLATRRNRNIATVALANKNARIAWAVLSRDEDYRGAKH
ncbi:MAG: IS110 family RNA-guided transposase [Telluria sp.]